ncbi:hypothetical protein [Promicromonospora sp. NPDC057488]|uniref:hypothetical protein n=1 Tax=Promicromonospora sp. NPDC057488 TaxID=3346147 RepID=UPI00366E9275
MESSDFGRVDVARHRLVRTIEDSALRVQDHLVWGQFADGLIHTNQYGIHGTSAACATLARHGRVPWRTLELLPEASIDGPAVLLFDETDLVITFKVTAIVEALVDAGAPDLESRPVVQRLFDSMLDGRGWGWHSVQAEPDRPRVLTTAHAVAVLGRIPALADREELHRAVEWLEQELFDDERLKLLERAYAAIALGTIRREGYVTANTDRVLRVAAADLRQWLRVQRGRPIEHVPRLFFVPKRHEVRNHTMLFPDQVIVAHALLLAEPRWVNDRSVRELVKQLCAAVSVHGGPRAEYNDRVSFVDINWLDRFLDEAQRARVASGVPFEQMRFVGWLRRLPPSAVGIVGWLVITVATTSFALTAGLPGWVTAVLTTVASVAAGVVTTIVLNWTGRE